MAQFEDIYRHHKIVVSLRKVKDSSRWTGSVQVFPFGESEGIFETSDLPEFPEKSGVIEYAVHLARENVDQAMK